MFSTKSEVDKHVENCLKRITNEKERNNRSYTFAKLYYNVGEYEQTRRYINSYLGAKPKSPEGHYLLGLTLEKLGKRDSALEAYKTSLHLDPKQNNLVLKVCEFLTSEDMELNTSDARYICELAEMVDPHNPSIYNLKEKLILKEEKNPDSVITLLLKELEIRPTDVNLRVRLLKNFLQNQKINEAFKHAYDIEERNLQVFSNSFIWYETVSEILMRYKRQSQPGNLTWPFWCLYMSVLDKVLCLRLDEKNDNIKESAEYVQQLFNFDQSLFEASQSINDCPDKLLATEFLNHYKGQLYFHIATTIFKQATEDLLEFKEAASITLPLFFTSYHIKPVDLHGNWINHLDETQKRFLKRWYSEAAYRCSQAGHILLASAKDRKSVMMSKANQHSSGMWQEQLFKKVFIVRDQQLKINTSYFVMNHIEVNLKLPTKGELLEYDEESLYLYPDNLKHYIWVSLNNDLIDIKYIPFQGLQLSVKNLNNCGAETLNLLDIQAFIYCATLCAKTHVDSLKQMLYYNMDRPDLLPEAITGQLCTLEQEKFLIAAYKIFKNQPSSDSGELRLTLIRGIEVIRCIGRHGLNVSLLVKLANIFSEKANKCNKQSEIEFADARAELYWKAALPLLEKIKNNQAVTYSSTKIFEYKGKDMSLSEVIDQIDKGKLFLGILAMKRKEHDKALNILTELKDPYASFYQAQIYKNMADIQINQNKESVTSEMRSRNIILLSKARDCFYLTLDRLRESIVDRNHPLNAQLGTEIEKIERLLSRIDPDCSNRNECDGMSDENVSSTDSADHFTSVIYSSPISNIYNSPYTHKNETSRAHHTPINLNFSKKEAKPSPERLDAQLRQLVATRDATMNQVMEQNKVILESHRYLLDELRSFKDALYNLSGQVDDMKNLKINFETKIEKSAEKLQTAMEDLQNFRNVTDLVYELKREIAEIKRDTSKHQQQVNEDLYVLDDEYSDYNIANSVNFNQNLYQNYPNRIQPPVPPVMYPPGLYQSLYAYGYPNLPLPQPALPYGNEQLPPDLRGLPNPTQSPNPPFPHLNQLNIQQPLNLASTGNVNSFLTGQNLSQSISQSSAVKDAKVVTPVSTIAGSSFNSRSAPVNVVITSSDPLPTLSPAVSQPVLSVTIPPQHIKGNIPKSQPHNYQIPLPTVNVSTTPSVLNKPAPALSTEGILSNVAAPVYSAVSDTKSSKNLGMHIEKSLEETFASSGTTNLTKIENSSETTLFECPAKLYNFSNDDREFKEIGSGLFKILENKEKSMIRILMRQDAGRIIANHFVTKDMKMVPTKENAYYWNALDYSEGKQKMEKFCLKFKNAEDANKFYNTFEQCKNKFNDDFNKTSENQKSNTLGGFVFSSTPTFNSKETTKTSDVEPPEKHIENKTQSPFANFSFGVLNRSNSSMPNTSGTMPSLLSNITSTSNKPASPDTSKHADSFNEEFVPTAEFQPVIPLPDVVEVKTGEENAEILFDCRAKLLRFDSEKKEWKERGLGNIKILKEKTLIRLLMRREQIHKVCCNHQLLKSMNFQYKDNLKVLTWCAQDFAEEVLKPETFAIRFKTEEQASEFLECLLAAQVSLNEDNSLVGAKIEKKVEDRDAQKNFADTFKPPKGNWECKICYVSNDSNANKCIACESNRVTVKTDNVNLSKPKESERKSTSETKITSSWVNAFKPNVGSWECQTCYIKNDLEILYCVACETPKDDTVPKKDSSSNIKGINLETPFKFNFGIGAGTNTITTESTTTVTNTFKFGSSSSSAFSFQSPVNSTELAENKSSSFVFGSPSVHEFDFKPRSPRKSTGNYDEESDCSYVEEEIDNIHFKPVIPLPDKVEVKTGEEDEEVLYCHRAKLFRFICGEWKERGVGDLKILKNKTNGKLRVLMRRDQVLKICLNFNLTNSIEFLAKDEKTWLFVAADFSEGEVSHDQFCLRFKNDEIAQEFKETLAKILEKSDETTQNNKDSENDDNSDVEFISETTVKPEEAEEARKLFLPSKFFFYRQLSFCECDQCQKDDEYFKGTIFERDCLSVSSSSSKTPKSGSSIYGTPNSFSFGALNQDISLKDRLVKPSIFPKPSSVTGSTEALFSTPTNTLFSTPVSSSTTTAGNLFGSKFGSNNLFTTQNNENAFSFTSKLTGSSSTTNVTPSSNSNSSIFSSSQIGSGNNIFQTKNNLVSSSSDSKLPIGSSQIPPTNLFGSSTFFPSSTPTNSNIFSTTPTTNVGGIGTNNLKTTASTTTTSVFSSFTSKTTSASSIFGTPSFPTTSIFGTKETKTIDTPKDESTISPYGAVNAGSLFGSSNTSILGSGVKYEFGKGGNVFGDSKQNVQSLFGNPTNNLKTVDLKDDDEVVLKCSSDVTFSSLAKHSDTIAPDFTTSSKASIDQPFGFLGAGAPVFGSKKKQEADSTIDTSQQGQDNEEEAGDEEYDPQFEPVIPLPEAIVVTTGEEDEEVIFNERAKLYRYDPDLKEWKERGVGQIKILHHPTNGTYRLILRREQVHKIVLNQLITSTLELQPMSTSDKAWVWAGCNYVEGETSFEQLAVRFKYQETAQKFYSSVQKCVSELTNQEKSVLPASIQNYGLENVSTDSDPHQQSEENDYDEEDDPYDEDYEGERSTLFAKNCKLQESITPNNWIDVSKGEIQVCCDSNLGCTKITFMDDNGALISNSVIDINTLMTLQENHCTWKTIELANEEENWRNLRAIFDSNENAKLFYNAYLEGISYAQEWELTDDIPSVSIEEIE